MLKIIRLKPNPAGKDRAGRAPLSASQLAAEWVDLQNTGRQAADLAGLEIYHLAHPAGGGKPEWRLVTRIKGSLEPGQVVRVHSGAGPHTSIIRPEDLSGADFHVFTGTDRYLWNNAEGDCAWIVWTSNKIGDKACYDPHPPEGQVLHRSGDKLIPVSARA